jgi:hypothetical protein
MKIGDLVYCDLRASHGGDIYQGYVIGHHTLSRPDSEIVILADEKAWGMPVNVAHCTLVSSGHDEIAQRLRERALGAANNLR